MKKLFIYYSFIIITLMSLAGFLGATTVPQLLSAAVFYPLAFFFLVQILPRREKAAPILREISESIKESHSVEHLVPEKDDKVRFDKDRRMFIKLIGSAGVTVFLFSLFTKKAEAAFFGSVPGPGTVAIKNKEGVQIDPAEKSPTDGYALTELADGVTSYYGYVDKNGNWYILKEDALGHYRYAKGTTDFSSNWDNRADEDLITYDTFDHVF
jgi:hypothetical protein